METYEPDFKEMKLLIWDGSGENIDHAVRLARDCKEVYYFTTWEESASFRGYALGMNMAENLVKVMDFFQPINDNLVDWVLFLDMGAGGTCHYLRENSGLPVYGSGLGEDLEKHRFETRKIQKQIGLAHPKGHKAHQVVGIRELEKFIKENPNKYVKLDVFRGDKESFPAKDVDSIQGDLTELEVATGALSEERPFMVEDFIEAKVETGIDAFFNGKEYLRPFLVGIEHGMPYIGRSYETGAPFIEELIKKTTPVLQEKNHRGAISIEEKVINRHFACPIDWTMRFPSPLGIIYTQWIKNYTPVMWACTNSQPIKIQAASKYVLGVNLKCTHANDNWLTLDIKEKDRDKVKLWDACRDMNGTYHLVSGASGGIYIVILGDNLDKMIKEAEETAKKVDARNIDKTPLYKLYEIMDEIKEFRKMGIDF
jgi:hypothetical protein